MTAAEARRHQWEQLKDQPLSEKLKYIFTYYWVVILVVICIIAFAVSWISDIINQKEIVLCGYLINSGICEDYEGNFQEDFLKQMEIDPEKNSFKITSNVSYSVTSQSEASRYVLESIVVQCAAKELDFIVADWETFPCFSSYYDILTERLPAEKAEQWGSYFVYVERSAMEALVSGNFGQEIVYPEMYTSTEGLEDPIPIGIRIPASSPLMDAYMFPAGDVVLGITISSDHIENTISFLEYILN